MKNGTNITDEIYKNILEDIGYQPIQNQLSDEFNFSKYNTMVGKMQSTKGPKEAVPHIELTRKIQKLERKIVK